MPAFGSLNYSYKSISYDLTEMAWERILHDAPCGGRAFCMVKRRFFNVRNPDGGRKPAS